MCLFHFQYTTQLKQKLLDYPNSINRTLLRYCKAQTSVAGYVNSIFNAHFLCNSIAQNSVTILYHSIPSKHFLCNFMAQTKNAILY